MSLQLHAAAPARGVSSPAGHGVIVRAARALVHRRLNELREGALTIEDAAGTVQFGSEGDLPRAMLRVSDPRFYPRVVTAGSMGFAESYLRGEWEADDLTAVLRVFARNVARHGGGRWTHAALAVPLLRLGHWLRRNTRAGSRNNIVAHYDLGNDFYALFLDETMTYSCGVFEHAASTMQEASTAKLDRICRKLGLRKGLHVLEIGTGWGSFAIHAASRYGCHVTTTTISPAQGQLARERIAAAGLTGSIEVLAVDYRDLRGSFDRLVSIEMIEAVGHENLPEYFKSCARLLRDDGCMALQAITIPDRDYPTYLTSADFIQRYVFPGSCVPSLGAMTHAVGAHTDLRIEHVESIGAHYAETLRRWRAAFEARLADVRAMGYDERFIRLWIYYLCYCEAGFQEHYIDDLQLVLAKPACGPFVWREGAPPAVTGSAA